MKDAFFSNGFYFIEYIFDKYSHTDNRLGAPQHYIAYLKEGQARIVSQGRTLQLQAGDVFYIPKDLSYQSYWFDENRVRLHSYGFSFFPDSENRSFLLQKINCGDALRREVAAIPLNRSADCASLAAFFTCLTKLLPLMESETPCREEALLTQAQAYLYRHPHCRIAEVAQHCCISESALYALFSERTGTTPNRLRQQALTEQAVHLLATTDRSIQEISDTLGFSSTSYFRKILKQHTGKTPGEIRKSARSV